VNKTQQLDSSQFLFLYIVVSAGRFSGRDGKK